MPRVDQHELQLGAVADALTACIGEATPSRPPGWHVSGLMRATQDLGKGGLRVGDAYREPNNWDAELAALPPGLLGWGHLWEAAARPIAAQEAAARGLTTTGAVRGSVDGIHGSADGLVLTADGDVHAVLEFKFRFSDRTSPAYMEKWQSQTKAYCRMWQTRRVWFVVGYVRQKPPGGGAYLYEVVYTAAEIEAAWTALQGMRQHLEQG